MKKRVFAIFACMVFTFAMVTGCGKKADTAPETPDTENAAAETETLEPLTEDEILELYADASAIYEDICLVSFDTDTDTTIIKDDNTYYRITDERFADYDEFQKYLAQYFTEGFLQAENLIDDFLFAEGKDGNVYVLGAGRGTDIFYAGYALGEPVIAEDLITLDVTAYYTVDEPYEGDLFNNQFPGPENEFETETFQFTLIPEDGAWKFDTFKIFY